MIALMAALAAAQAMVGEPPALGPDAFEARMKASAAAAQALQGPWDGTWVLSDARGRRLFVFQITDPAAGAPLAGAWRETSDAGRIGWIDTIVRRGGGIELSFTPAGEGAPTVIRVEWPTGRSPTGWMEGLGSGRGRRVRLSRPP